ncbi:MAG: exo-alpha-sialidase, partial [Candidatus Hydrogenedentes bacterium]|nr:exo-alpha-sialidase [Candidatus Hydrogenedentota bacterium]
ARPLLEGPVGYYVVNNDRMVQLSNGGLVIPSARHNLKGEPFTSKGRALCFLSDDAGATWRISSTIIDPPEGAGSAGLQEPAVVELQDGRLLMLCRTGGGCQYQSWSDDGGDTWLPAEPTDTLSPVSPASIERVPGTGALLLVWNDHSGEYAGLGEKRTPLAVAVSTDEGQSWTSRIILEDNPDGWYCYTAIAFVGDHILLGHCAGDRRENNGLALTQVLRLPLSHLALP